MLLPVPVHKGKGKKQVRFIDSLLHLSGSLDSLLKDFFSTSVDPRLRLSKGHFPHSFNTPENQDYVGPIPALEYFSLDMMKLGNGRDRFKKPLEVKAWHDLEVSKNETWYFQRELVKYCEMDVRGLAALLKVYMDIGIQKGSIPLKHCTGPSFVHEVILARNAKNLLLPECDLRPMTKILKAENPTMSDFNLKSLVSSTLLKNSRTRRKMIEEFAYNGMTVLKPAEQNMVRRCLRGGRTEVRDSLKILDEEEISQGTFIKYQDVVSLYPWAQLTQEYPVGAPIIHWYDYGFKPCFECQFKKDEMGRNIMECDCPLLRTGPRKKNHDGKGYRGLTVIIVLI